MCLGFWLIIEQSSKGDKQHINDTKAQEPTTTTPSLQKQAENNAMKREQTNDATDQESTAMPGPSEDNDNSHQNTEQQTTQEPSDPQTPKPANRLEHNHWARSLLVDRTAMGAISRIQLYSWFARHCTMFL